MFWQAWPLSGSCQPTLDTELNEVPCLIVAYRNVYNRLVLSVSLYHTNISLFASCETCSKYLGTCLAQPYRYKSKQMSLFTEKYRQKASQFFFTWIVGYTIWTCNSKSIVIKGELQLTIGIGINKQSLFTLMLSIEIEIVKNSHFLLILVMHFSQRNHQPNLLLKINSIKK